MYIAKPSGDFPNALVAMWAWITNKAQT